MLHPQPRLKLSPLKNLLYIYYPLLEGNQIPLVPYTSNDICPDPSPDLILLITNLKQVETLEIQLQIMLLYEGNTYPLKAQRPYLPAQTHSCRKSSHQHPPGCHYHIQKSLHLPQELIHLTLVTSTMLSQTLISRAHRKQPRYLLPPYLGVLDIFSQSDP